MINGKPNTAEEIKKQSNELRILRVKYKGLLEEYTKLLDKFIEIKENEKMLNGLVEDFQDERGGYNGS